MPSRLTYRCIAMLLVKASNLLASMQENLHRHVGADTAYLHSSRHTFTAPLWELAQLKLSHLRLNFLDEEDTEIKIMPDIDEQDEVEICSAPSTMPAHLDLDLETRHAFLLAVSSRTIVAAARGNRLRQLYCSHSVQQPFAVRALLPYWVQIDEWQRCQFGAQGWLAAASTLRDLLSDASRWLGTTSRSAPRVNRLLTGAEVQSLQAHYWEARVPAPWWKRSYPEPDNAEPQLVERYLPWLAEDAELAQRVADAWNDVYERGASGS